VRKRDRTADERSFDKLLAQSIAHLGQTPTAPEEPNAFRHVFVWDRMGKMGQRCRILKQRGTLAYIEFEDGFTMPTNRMAIRRSKEGL
jgi:hypothetical protein